MGLFHKNRDQFLEHLKKTEGYSKKELSEVDDYMRKEYGDHWTNHEINTTIKQSYWHKFKAWFSSLFKRIPSVNLKKSNRTAISKNTMIWLSMFAVVAIAGYVFYKHLKKK